MKFVIDKIISTNEIKVQLPTLMRIYLVVNISQVVWYKEQVEGQKKKKVKPVEIKGVKK